MESRTAVSEVVREVRERLQRLYGHGLSEVILYGSQARGDAQEGSDIDLLVVLEDFQDQEAELARMDPIGSELSLTHDVVITFVPIRARDYLLRNTPLLLNIRREGVRV